MKLRWLVSGEVQGVGYRVFVWHEATALEVEGSVRNLADGTVEVIASGDPGQLGCLEAAIGRGPKHARVCRVEKSQISDEVTVDKGFNIK